MHGEGDVAIVHFYCDYREQQAQTAQNFARSILRQLSMRLNSNAIPASVSDFYQRTRNEVNDQSWYLELRRTICRVASTFSTVYLVIDALDETESTSHLHGLLDLVNDLRIHLAAKNPKILATSRKHKSTIQNFFQNATKLNITADKQDLRRILSKIMVDHHNAPHTLDEELKEDILNQLCASAHGMFLLPILQIQDVLSQLTKSEMRRALRGLSSNLAEVFQSTIGRILNLPSDLQHAMNRRNLAIKALMWISHAKRTLTVTELQHALAIRLEESELDRENFIEPALIVDSCFGLVEIDEKSSTIRFVHYSLQEHLRSHKHGLFVNGDTELTKVCLRYLSLDSVKDLGVKNRSAFVAALESLPFLDYAAAEWGYHAAAISDHSTAIQDLALGFLKSRPHLFAAARVRDHKSPNYRKWRGRMSTWVDCEGDGAGISLCASFGSIEFLKLLLDRNEQPMLQAKNMYGSSPLHEAAMQGYDETVKLLLVYGADVLALNMGNSTPLHLVVENNHVSTARLLLRQQTRAQLDAAGREGWTVLHRAAHNGQEEMVILLLQHGAAVNDEDRKGTIVNAEDIKGMTPLHLAARMGHDEVVRLLIVAGVQVHCKDHTKRTPLDYAVTSGQITGIKLLLDNGAPLEHHDFDKWTALKRAARRGDERIVAELLERGADVLHYDYRGEIPLHSAARSGSIRVVELLLKNYPHLEQKQLVKTERKGSTPRDVAYFTAHFNIYKTLRDAEVGHSSLPTDTPLGKLTQAIENGKLDKIRRLLAARTFDIDSLIDERQPALHLAMQEEQADIVKTLLAHGADINSIGFHRWTPLHITASIGSPALTRLCLSHGANVGARTESAQTALHKACSSGNVQVMRAILEAGADKEAVNQRGMRPLHIAAHASNLAMVRCLVQEYQVDITATDDSGNTAAAWAERSGHLDIRYYLKGEEKAWKARPIRMMNE